MFTYQALSFLGGLLLTPQGYPPPHMWGMALPPQHHQNQPFCGAAGTYPGATHHQTAAPAAPIGSHHQFIPLQVHCPYELSPSLWPSVSLYFSSSIILFVHLKAGREHTQHRHSFSHSSYVVSGAAWLQWSSSVAMDCSPIPCCLPAFKGANDGGGDCWGLVVGAHLPMALGSSGTWLYGYSDPPIVLIC